MMYVFVCIVCICLYFLQQKLLGASIQTHSARYIQYIQNKSKINQKYRPNTYKYIQIHSKKIKNPCFFRLFFLVCILYVLYLSCCMLFLDTCHIQQSYCVYVCACIPFPRIRLSEYLSLLIEKSINASCLSVCLHHGYIQ